MSRILVTLGTDGANNWVQIPSGEKLSLGTVSPLTFVAKLSAGPMEARRVMNAFNGAGSAVVGVDLDKMWVLFRPKRTRWAGGREGSFIAPSEVKSENQQTERSMASIFEDLKAVEQHVGALKKQASEGKKASKADVEALVHLAGKIKSPNQSTNKTYYNLGAPDVYEVGDTPPKVETAPTAKAAGIQKLAYDTFKANADVADGVLSKAEATVSAIDRLATAGKRFNSVRAKLDVSEVTTKVAGIMQDADLTQPWVRGDLDKLATRMGQLHGLFEKA